MKILIVGDLHLTDRPEDEYRFKFFARLREIMEKQDIKHLVLLGDLTEIKDRHSGVFADRVFEEIKELTEGLGYCYILKGNHDFADEEHPFFKHLGLLRNVHFITAPTTFGLVANRPTNKGSKVYRTLGFIPYTKNWSQKMFMDIAKESSIIFLHQTIQGARVNGIELDGVALPEKVVMPILAGDIHTPQRIGTVEYVGAPYAVRFGDTFNPRVAFYDLIENEVSFLKILGQPKKWIFRVATIKELKKELKQVAPGDFVKVIFQLTRAEFVDWRSLRDEAEAMVKLTDSFTHSILLEEVQERLKMSDVLNGEIEQNPLDLFKGWIKEQGIAAMDAEVGAQILKEATK
jgi:DNA repair exonuclease SbcCD nuclease subunit